MSVTPEGASAAVEVLKVVVPAFSALLGALLAGGIALWTALKTSKLAHSNSMQTLRYSAFGARVAEAYDAVIGLLITILEGKDDNPTETNNRLVCESVWLDQQVADSIAEVTRLEEPGQRRAAASASINAIRRITLPQK